MTDHRRPTCSLGLTLATLALLPLMAVAQSQVASEKQLREVQQRIADMTAQMSERVRERDTLTAALSDSEKKLAAAQQRRRELRGEQDAAAERLVLADERARLQSASLDTEREELARQLRAAYASGRQERIKLALNQQSPATLGRMMTYYGYLGDARLANINSLRRGLQKLADLRAQAQAERDTLATLASEADTLIATLARGREERSRLVANIDKKLQQEAAMLTELESQEQDLSRLLAELSSILSDYPINAEEPISQLRGQLTWPVAGRLVTSFGDSRGVGNVRSKGVVLAANTGDEVRAIYHGRIAYADWLPGLGLLTIIDHGDGLLSLYGYNETLLKSVGDWISPGEVIATVGNSGGQARPALYFELRRGREAVNPRPWFRNRPGPDRR